MHHIFETIISMQGKGFVRLGAEFLQDLVWWRECSTMNNGIPIQKIDREVTQLMMFNGVDEWQMCLEMGTFYGGWDETQEDGLAYRKQVHHYVLEIPEDEFHSPLVWDLMIVWCFISEFMVSMKGRMLVIYCHRLQTYNALIRLRSSNAMGILSLKQIFVLCNSADINLYPSQGESGQTGGLRAEYETYSSFSMARV